MIHEWHSAIYPRFALCYNYVSTKKEKTYMHTRALTIKLLLLDVDGVLTDGLLYYGQAGETMKTFHARDGLGIRLLLENGITVGLITGRSSKIVEHRAEELGIPHVYQGRLNKLDALKELMETLKIDLTDVAFMGDDIIDLPILSRVGLSACPQDAHSTIQKTVHFISQYPGGRGAVRELCDLLLTTQHKLEPILQRTLDQGKLFTEARPSC